MNPSNQYELFYERKSKRLHFNVDDCLIEVTACVGLPEYYSINTLYDIYRCVLSMRD